MPNLIYIYVDPHLICLPLVKKNFQPVSISPQVHTRLDFSVEPARHLVSTGRSKTKKEIREEQREWLQWLVVHTGESLSQMAERAGMADVTLTRFANQPDYEGNLSPLTIRLLTEYTGLPGPDEWRSGGRRGLAEDAAPYDVKSSPDTPLNRMIRSLVEDADGKDRAGVFAKIVRTRALEEIGYREGDIVIIDQNQKPAFGDVVCAQVYDWDRMTAETVLRLYRRAGAFGVLMPIDATSDPLPVDDKGVKIMGVVAESFRPRRTDRAA